MASTEQSVLELVLTAKNLTAPSVRELQKDLEATEQATKRTGAAGLASGQQFASGFSTASEHAGKFGSATAAGAKQAADGLHDAQGKVGSLAGAFGQNLGVAVPLAVAAAVTAVTAMGISSIKSFTELDRSLREVNTLFGLTGKESADSFKQISEQVREFSVRTGTNAVDASKALYQAISAGIPRENVMEFLGVASKTAVGGLISTTASVNLLTSATNAFGLPASEAGRVADVLFTTVKSGKTTMDELSRSLFQVAPIASAAGLTLEETTAAVAGLTVQGVPTAEAMTRVRAAIQAFIKPSSEAAEVAKALGLNFDATSLKTDGLKGSFDKAYAAADGDVEILGKLFGSVEGLGAVVSLTGEKSDIFTKTLDANAEAAGASGKAYDEMEQSAARSFEKMQAKAKDLQDRLGEKLLPVAINLLEWVDKVGVSLGAWPGKVPPPEQTESMKALGESAKDTAEFIRQIGKAFEFLNSISGAAVAARLKESLGITSTVVATDALNKANTEYAERVAFLDQLLKTNNISQSTHATKLAEVQAAHKVLAVSLTVGTGAQKDYRSEQQKLDEAIYQGTISIEAYNERTKELKELQEEASKVEEQGGRAVTGTSAQRRDAATAFAEQATAALEAANATAKVTEQDARSSTAAKEKIAASQAAEKAAKEAAAEAKRRIDAAIAEEKRHAKAVEDAKVTASEAYRKYGREIGDFERDGLGKVQAIREKHDQDYNEAISAAQSQQTDIKQRAADALVSIEEESARRSLDVQERLTTLQSNEDESASDRRLQLQRRAADEISTLQERTADHQRRQEREDQDQRLRDQERNAERELALVERAANRQRALQDSLVQKEALTTDSTEQKAESEKRLTRTVEEDARKEKTATADETTQYERAKRDEAIRHERALRDATTDEQRAKETERHGDALSKETERHGDAVRKSTDRAAEDKRTRDLAFKDGEDKALVQATKNAARIDAEYQKKLAALDAEDRVAAETNAKQDARAEASRTLTATRRAEDELTTEQRAEASRTRQQTRESEDWTLRRTRAEMDLKQSLTDIEAKRATDIAAIEARREKDITASNVALVAKQQQIDAARDVDFGKFQADFAKRLRDMEQQFGDSMRKLSDLVPQQVAALTGRAAQNTASAAANLTAASAVSRAAVTSDAGASASAGELTAAPADAASPAAAGQTFGGQPQEVQELFAAVYGEDAAASWQAEHEAASNRGQGAGVAPSDAQDASFDTLTPASGLSAILARLNTALAVTNTLRGGDYRAASAPAVPPGVTLPRVTPKSATGTGTPAGPESSVSWAMAQVGRQDYIGLCQKFVENANGTTGRYPSAVAAAGALTTNAGGQMGDAPRGALVFFRPDSSNGYFGHVGISLGGGQMVSGAANGVSVDGASRYWSSLYSGYGLPRFAQGVRDFTGGMAMVGEQGPELVKLPRGSNVYSAPETRQMVAPAPIYLTLNVAGSVQTEQDLHRSIYSGLKDLQRRGLS